jgi:hypothetical protein
MKKRKLMSTGFLAAFLTVLFQQCAFAQTIKFNMGPELKTKGKVYPNRFVHADKN